MAGVTVEQLEWDDLPIGTVDFPRGPLVLKHGIGSGLARDPVEPGVVWAIADRGPNMEMDVAAEHYGWPVPHGYDDHSDAKMMPRPDMGPYMARLRIDGARITLLETVRLHGDVGPIPGVPIAGSDSGHEPALAMDGSELPPEPAGMDTEGIAALADGTFWVSEEYGPSLVRVDRSGKVLRRLVPRGCTAAEAQDNLPAIAARRHLNRGFEGVTVTPSGRRLFVGFQSPLAHPDKQAFEDARHVRLWELDADGQIVAQYLYPLDAPETFRRDGARKKPLKRKNLKICELSAVGERRLLVLERGSETCKIYAVELSDADKAPTEHLDIETRPTVEELSGSDGAFPLPVLEKHLLFSSDDHPEVAADIEGMTFVSDCALLLASDNDYGVEDKKIGFFRLTFDEPFTA